MHAHSRLTAFALVAATFALAGCHATVDARWASSNDTVDHWKKAMPTLPVEVRGALPDATNEQIAQAIPNATTVGTSGLTAPRLVVELGNGEKPRDDAYCAAPAKDSATSGAQARVSMTLTICDGTRLVASSRTPIDPAKTPVSALSQRVNSLKKLALIGIARGQIEEYQVQG